MTTRLLLILLALGSTISMLWSNLFLHPTRPLVPYADVLEPRIRQSDSDLWLSSINSNSGRGPFDWLMGILENVSGAPESSFSVLTAVLVPIGFPLIIWAGLSAADRMNSKINSLVAAVLVGLSTIQEPLNFHLSISGYGFIYSDYLRPATLSLAIFSVSIILLKLGPVGNLFGFFLAACSTILHPAIGLSSLIYFSIFIAFGEQPKRSKFTSLTLLGSGVAVGIGILAARANTGTLKVDSFANLYGRLVHPWHFNPEVYLNVLNVSFFICAVVALFTIGNRFSRPLVLCFTAVIVWANIFQWLIIFVWPIESLIYLGPSRMNVFIGAGLATLLLLSPSTFVGNRLGRERTERAIGSLALISTCLLSLLVNNLTTDRVELLRTSSLAVAAELHRVSERLILVQPGIETVGWRSYGGLDIWFDSLWSFPFDPKVIPEYARRYALVCGEKRADRCSTNDSGRLIAILRQESAIDALVLRKSGFKSFEGLTSDLEVVSTKSFIIVIKN